MTRVLQPKEQFQKFHEKERDEWRGLCGNRSVQLALNYAMAEMGALGYSAEWLKGANMFIYVALNLSELEVPMNEKYPAQPLQEEPTVPAQPS